MPAPLATSPPDVKPSWTGATRSCAPPSKSWPSTSASSGHCALRRRSRPARLFQRAPSPLRTAAPLLNDPPRRNTCFKVHSCSQCTHHFVSREERNSWTMGHVINSHGSWVEFGIAPRVNDAVHLQYVQVPTPCQEHCEQTEGAVPVRGQIYWRNLVLAMYRSSVLRHVQLSTGAIHGVPYCTSAA